MTNTNPKKVLNMPYEKTVSWGKIIKNYYRNIFSLFLD